MKKIIVSIAMLIATCTVFGENASYLIKQYKNIKKAEYVNATKKIKRQAKKNRYIEPDFYEMSQRLKKIEIVQVNLNERQKEILTKNIQNIDGYNKIYEKKNNTTNLLSKDFTLFPLLQYYGIEENGTIKDVIIRVDINGNDKQTMIAHVVGEFSIEELMKIVSLEETKTINLQEE